MIRRTLASNAPPTLIALAAGAGFASVLVLGTEVHPAAGLIVALSPLLIVAALNPKWTAVLTIIAFVLLEAFPWGLGETVERSTRTAFYATSLGIPGLYPPDVLIFGSIMLLMARKIVARQSLDLPNDRIQWALAAFAVLIIASALSSFVGGNPFRSATIVDTATVYKVNEQGAALIALFQFKNFAFLFFAYLLGLLYFESAKDVERLLRALFAAILLIVAIGFIRLVLRPSIVTDSLPLFYDSPSSWIFALAIFYWLIQILLRNTSDNDILPRGLLTIALTCFILLSYRRTMWGAIIVAALALLPLLPAAIRGRYLLVLLCTLTAAGVVFLLVPPLLSAVAGRLSETSSEDLSTIYRLSLFVWFRNHIDEIPLFGYGFRPLWDIPATLGYFRTNLENIHSLYFWLILRTGLVGFLGGAVAFLAIGRQITSTARGQIGKPYFALCTLVALAVVMLLFSGIFNPVYAEMRYVVLTGVALAFISRLPLILKNARSMQRIPV